MSSWTDWMSSHMLTCPSVKLLHMQCPGCGMQRSIICLLNGDLSGSLSFHPATIPFLFLIGLLPLHLIFRLPHGQKAIIFLQALVAILSLGLYVYKIIHHQIIV